MHRSAASASKRGPSSRMDACSGRPLVPYPGRSTHEITVRAPMKDSGAVTPGARTDPPPPLRPAEPQARWLTVRGRDVRAFWRPVVRWSLAAVYVPLLTATAVLVLAECVPLTHGDVAAYLAVGGLLLGALLG